MMDLAQLLPDILAGWKAEKTIPLKNNSDLYNYMDGGAELYISYGFGEALSRTFRKDDQPEVLAEVFDLLEPRNAFGVFTQTREQEIQQYGQGTYRIPGAVFFWEDRYFVSLSSWEPNPESDAFTDALAVFIDKQITGKGEKPGLVNLLPVEGMIPDGYKYFHHYVWLNAYFYLSDKNLFLIDDKTNAIMARYNDGDGRKYLLLVEYDDDVKAQKAFSTFGNEYFPWGLTDNCIMREDGTWIAAEKTGRLIKAVFNAGSKQSAVQLLDNILIK
jgi:hypothetical protein